MFGTMRTMMMTESDVTTVLSVLNTYRNIIDGPELVIRNCEWKDAPKVWCVHFKATDKHYGKIMKKLTENGRLLTQVSPNGKVSLFYERAL